MSRSVWAWARVVGSVLTLVVLVWRLGTGPFLDGIRSVDGGALAAAAGILVLTTVCYAWRWKIVAGGLGVDLTAAGCGGGVLPVGVPQRHAARRGRR